jgi:TPR repeat protein
MEKFRSKNSLPKKNVYKNALIKITKKNKINSNILKTINHKLFYVFLCVFAFLLATSNTNGQDKENNKNFNAGLSAYQSNNLPLAYQKFLAGAKEGHLNSQYNVALMYENGIGVKKNEKEALSWYTKAATAGNSAAQFNLGVLYENGRGTAVNFANANKWYRKAAAQNDGLAIGNLGMLYIRGDGVKVNKTAGVALLLLSVQVDQSPENTAKQNITKTSGLTKNMITDAQALADKMFKAGKNLLVPLDQFLKK